MINDTINHTAKFDLAYGIALGLSLSVFLYMLLFAIYSFIEKYKQASVIFFYGAISTLFIIFFNVYIIDAYDSEVMNSVPVWLLFIGKISVPVAVFFNYRTFVASLPIESIQHYLAWNRAEKSFGFFNILVVASICLLLLTDNPDLILTISLSLIICEHCLSLLMIKGSIRENFLKKMYTILIAAVVSIAIAIVALLKIYGLQGVSNLTFLVFNLLFSFVIILYNFVLTQHNLKESANNEKTLEMLSDGFFKNIYKALKEDEFFLLYQPKINLATRKICGVEALIRWQHGEKGLIPPDQFIPIAEKTNVINNICEWLITQVVADIKKMREIGLDIPVSLNFSVVNFNPEMVDFLMKELKSNDLPASSIIIEITETLFLDMNEQLINDINTLEKAGVGLSLDDFGAGHSSLRHLDKLPLCEVKIDKSLIQDIENHKQKAVIETLINMCHSLGLKVVAEGIEEEEILKELLNLNCAMGQGFGICRPQKIDALLEWIKTNLSMSNS